MTTPAPKYVEIERPGFTAAGPAWALDYLTPSWPGGAGKGIDSSSAVVPLARSAPGYLEFARRVASDNQLVLEIADEASGHYRLSRPTNWSAPTKREPGWRWNGCHSATPGAAYPPPMLKYCASDRNSGWERRAAHMGDKGAVDVPLYGNCPAYAFSAGGMHFVKTGLFGPPESRPLWVLADCTYSNMSSLPKWTAFAKAAMDGDTAIVWGINSFKPPTYMGSADVLIECLRALNVKTQLTRPPNVGDHNIIVVSPTLIVVYWNGSDPKNSVHGKAGDETWSASNSGPLGPLGSVAAQTAAMQRYGKRAVFAYPNYPQMGYPVSSGRGDSPSGGDQPITSRTDPAPSAISAGGVIKVDSHRGDPAFIKYRG